MHRCTHRSWREEAGDSISEDMKLGSSMLMCKNLSSLFMNQFDNSQAEVNVQEL